MHAHKGIIRTLGKLEAYFDNCGILQQYYCCRYATCAMIWYHFDVFPVPTLPPGLLEFSVGPCNSPPAHPPDADFRRCVRSCPVRFFFPSQPFFTFFLFVFFSRFSLIRDVLRFLPDGSVFDASNAPGRKPIAFKLGARQVIKGWEEVLRLMNVSERSTGGAPTSNYV